VVVSGSLEVRSARIGVQSIFRNIVFARENPTFDALVTLGSGISLLGALCNDGSSVGANPRR
jgi:hypothetical protein